MPQKQVEGTLVLQDGGEPKKICRPVLDANGEATGVQKLYIEWKKGPVLCSFFQCIRVPYPLVGGGFSTVEDEGKAATWNAAEMECTHSVCHMHPNGHNPPSKHQEERIDLLVLNSEADLRKSNKVSTLIINLCCKTIIENYRGDWDERTVTKAAKESARAAATSPDLWGIR